MTTPQKLATELFLFGFENYSFQEILTVLKAADEAYFNNSSQIFLSDEEYDTLKRYAQNLDPTNSYFLGVGSSVRGSKVKLPYPMGSLTQAYEGEILKWIEKHNLKNENVVITDKLDGISSLIVYDTNGLFQIGYSRGNGLEGADISRHLFQIPNIQRQVNTPNLVVRGELIMRNSVFLQVGSQLKSRNGQPYKNARNAVAGMMNAEKNDAFVYQHLEFVAYEVIQPKFLGKREQLALLEQEKFQTPFKEIQQGHKLTDHYLTEYLKKRRAESDFALDGIVIEVDNAKLRSTINPTKETLNPEYARKYKIADDSNLTIATVIGVDWNISKDGYLKPRVKIEPVNLMGATVQYATGFNAKFIAENNIGPGAKIKITRSGDVIPFITEVVEPAVQADMPHDDVEWTSTGVDLVLKNAHKNSTVKFEQLNDFFSTIDVPHLREGNLQKIFDAGFEEPESVINLTQQDIAEIVNSSIIARKIFNGIREKLTNIPLYVLMGAHSAFGRGVGVRKMKKLYEAFEGDMSKCADIVNIINVNGFDHKTATKISNGYPKFLQFLNAIRTKVSIAAYQAPATGRWSGETVVFTGIRSKEIEKMITDQGGKIASAVSNKTTLVVAENVESTSGKATKARELGIPIIDINQLKEKLKI